MLCVCVFVRVFVVCLCVLVCVCVVRAVGKCPCGERIPFVCVRAGASPPPSMSCRNGKLAYGMFAGNSTGGVSWDTLPDESSAISVDQLDDIEVPYLAPVVFGVSACLLSV